MADIAAANITYTEGVNGYARRLDGGHPPRYTADVRVAFGNNTLTYPTGGVPLNANKLGMPQGIVEGIIVLDQGTASKGFKIEPVIAATPLLRFMVEDTVATNTPLKEHTNATFVPNPASILLRVTGY